MIEATTHRDARVNGGVSSCLLKCMIWERNITTHSVITHHVGRCENDLLRRPLQW